MSSRPKRKSAEEAIAKIREVLTWESCPESSDLFKAAAEKMELEFQNAKRRRMAKELTTPTSTDDEDDDDDEEDEDSERDDGSAPSSSDMYSDPGSSSDDDDEELSDTKSDQDDTPEIVLDEYKTGSVSVECLSP
jgi:hypothetical protein